MVSEHGRDPTTAWLPSAVSARRTSAKPSSENFPRNPLGGSGTLLRRELTGIGHRPDGDELLEFVAGLRHQAGNALSEIHVPPTRLPLRRS